MFTQTTMDTKGRPILRTPTIYVGAMETAERLGRRLYTEAWERGWSRTAKKALNAASSSISPSVTPNPSRPSACYSILCRQPSGTIDDNEVGSAPSWFHSQPKLVSNGTNKCWPEAGVKIV